MRCAAVACLHHASSARHSVPVASAAQVIDFQILSEDYSKLVFACADRSLTFHARFGGYVSVRLPKVPRSVTYHAPSADVLAVGSSSEVYRCALNSASRCVTGWPPLCCASTACGCADTHRLSLPTG